MLLEKMDLLLSYKFIYVFFLIKETIHSRLRNKKGADEPIKIKIKRNKKSRNKKGADEPSKFVPVYIYYTIEQITIE